MKFNITIPITISMVIELDKFNLEEAVEQVKSICFDDPSIITEAINESDEDVSVSRHD